MGCGRGTLLSEMWEGRGTLLSEMWEGDGLLGVLHIMWVLRTRPARMTPTSAGKSSVDTTGILSADTCLEGM